MKRSFGKVVLAVAAVGSVVFSGVNAGNVVSGAAIPQTSVAVNVQVQQPVLPAIDWTKGAESDMTVIGIGLPPEGAGINGVVLARRAAVVDAYRNLAELIEGVQVDAETVMGDFIVRNDMVRTQVNALIKGAKILEEGSDGEGCYFVKMRIPLYGSDNSLAAIAIPEIRPAAIEPMPAVDETGLSKKDVKAVQRAGYTGVIVDASGLGLEATFSPVIYDENGRAVYGMKNIDPDYAISKGMVEYAASLEGAVAKSRAGANPLVIKATAVRGGGNSVNKVNVVVSADDGDRILLANEKSGMLHNCAVVFVK